jgi:hypothetical protein
MVLTQKLTVQMTNKIYLDDVRTPVANDWVVVRNFEQFVKAVEKIGLDNIETISLDHDLGDSAMWEYHNNVSRNYSLDYNNIKEKTGYDCAKWLVNRFYEENPDWANKDRSVKRAKKMPFPTVYTHSANPIGSANIMGYINNFLMNEAKEQTCVRVRIDHTA